MERMEQEDNDDLFWEAEGITVKEGKRGGYDCPQIFLSKQEERRIQRPWRRGVIVKLLGRKIGYKALENRLKQMWVRKGIIRIIDLGYDYYLVCFTHDDDKNAVMMDGPWFIYDHYLTVKEWSPDFHPENDSIVKVAVWIRISGLPVEYYDPKILYVIGNLVGNTIKVDKNTLQGERGKYARICVEVDLTKPLFAMFELKDKSYRVEFEGLHLLCITCGKFGHYKEGCPMKKHMASTVPSTSVQGAKIDDGSDVRSMTIDSDQNGDRPWQVVQKQRRTRKPPEAKKKLPATGSWLAKAGTRFQVLGDSSGTIKENNNGADKINDEEIMIVEKFNSVTNNKDNGFMKEVQHQDDIITTNKGCNNETITPQNHVHILEDSGRQGVSFNTGGSKEVEVQESEGYKGDSTGNRKKHKKQQEKGIGLRHVLH
ncbi:uncharacterized protein LOC131658066 [Vicia villosa]|uniref:uncharacterized protein LOC131658066 n=1 Tax=Vicia villosa TaxID=3911 RepID=UPI00273C862C|nr:uncharacterized protein LOC131658066 [Vicia villosa]